MTTTKLTITCPECGAETSSWHQRCDSCGALLHEEKRKLNQGQWKWQFITIVLFVCIAVGLLLYFSNNDETPVVNEESETESETGFLYDKTPTPERLAEVLGSQEAYEQLRDSDLIKMKDFGGPESKVPDIRKMNLYVIRDSSGTCVYVTLEGEIAEIDLNSRRLVLKNGKDEILLFITELWPLDRLAYTHVRTPEGSESQYIPLEEFKVGDWLDSVTVFINANRAEVRSIYLTPTAFQKYITAERLAEVLGSWEAYEELRNSDLIKTRNVANPKRIAPEIRNIEVDVFYDSSGVWVYAAMEGEIADLDLDAKKLTLKNGEDEMVLAISEFIKVYVESESRYIPWEELKVGDWLVKVSVLINAKRAEVRSIHIY